MTGSHISVEIKGFHLKKNLKKWKIKKYTFFTLKVLTFFKEIISNYTICS